MISIDLKHARKAGRIECGAITIEQLNLKGIVFKLHNRDEVTLTLKKDGEGTVLASDIDLPHDVELINPDHVIANLTAGGKLDMQIKVEKGRGYVPGNVRRLSEDANKTIGRMILDASFSPVRRVSYSVESARVEQRTDLDKLVINIETNGVITPEEAIRQSARVLVDQLNVFAALEGTEAAAEAPSRAPGLPPPAPKLPTSSVSSPPTPPKSTCRPWPARA